MLICLGNNEDDLAENSGAWEKRVVRGRSEGWPEPDWVGGNKQCGFYFTCEAYTLEAFE